MGLLEVFVAAGAGAIIGASVRIFRDWYRRPKLEIKLTSSKSKTLVFERLVEKGSSGDWIPKWGGNPVYQYDKFARDISLTVRNNGKTPAEDCKASMTIFEDGDKVHKPINMGWRRNAPILFQELEQGERMRKRTQAVDINRNDEEELDLIRQTYEILQEGPRIQNKELSTHESFRNHKFDLDKEYKLKVTITSSNAEPETSWYRLNWNGQLAGETKGEKLESQS